MDPTQNVDPIWNAARVRNLPRRRICSLAVLFVALGLLGQAGPGTAQTADFPLESGEAVATCFSGYKNNQPNQGIDLDAFVVAVVDVRTPPAQGAVPGQHWFAPMYHNEDTPNPTGNPKHVWTAGALGQVFGLALDDAPSPSIFVGASSAYFPVFNPDGTFADGNFGPLGSGGVYRLDGATGAICEHARLHEDGNGQPLEGPALGNIAYDRVNRQLFVSSFEDGRIVRLPASSPCNTLVKPLGSFDHGVDGRPAEGLAPIPDDGAIYSPSTQAADRARTCRQPIPDSGFTSLGRRVWAVQVFEGRLYYSVWNEDQGRSDPNAGNEIWSIGLLPGGDFDKQDVRRETEIPPLPGQSHSNPVSDIAFSADGRLLVAERVRCRDHGVEGSNAHRARVLEYERNANGRYGQLIREIPIGYFSSNQNAAGGVDYGFDTSDGAACDQTVWATGDALRLGQSFPAAVYGLQGTPDGTQASALNLLQASFFTDLDESFSTIDKTEIGDVEVARNDCLDPPCLDQVTFDTLCVVEDGVATGDFTWRFRLRNESGGPIHHLFLNDLPPGVSAQPDHLVFQPPLLNGQLGLPQTVTFTGVTPGTVLELGISIHDAQLAECCAETVLVELPVCECAQIISEQRPACLTFPFSTPPPYRYRVDLQNLSGRTAQYFFAAAVDPGDLSTPILPDDLTVQGSGALTGLAAPGETTGSVNFLIDGPGARPGREVCLFLNLSDPNLRSCCSIPRCFTLPDCTIDLFVDPPWPLDGTTLHFAGGEIVLSGFGEGVGGIDVEIPGADVFATGWAPIDRVDGQGAEVRVATFGLEDEELATVEARELGGEVEIRAAFRQQRDEIVVEVLDEDGSVRIARTGRSNRVAVTLESWPAGFVMQDDLIGITLLGHEDTLSVRLPGGTRMEGAGIRIRDANEIPNRSFARAALRVEGLDELRLGTLQAMVDCDGDGVADDEAIARGLVEDIDGDGVPDGCRPLQPTRVVK